MPSLAFGPRAPTFSLFICPAATYPLGNFLHQPAPVSFYWKETGAPTTAASHDERGFAPAPLVTIGVTNAEVTSNSDADDGAAAQGMACTWLTARHAPVIASLLPLDSGSRGAGFVSQRSLHPPTGKVFRRPDHEMPLLLVVRSRQSRVSGQPSQVAGALIPDNTQHSWRDDVGRRRVERNMRQPRWY